MKVGLQKHPADELRFLGGVRVAAPGQPVFQGSVSVGQTSVAAQDVAERNLFIHCRVIGPIQKKRVGADVTVARADEQP